MSKAPGVTDFSCNEILYPLPICYQIGIEAIIFLLREKWSNAPDACALCLKGRHIFSFPPCICQHTTEIIMLSDMCVLIKVSSSIPLVRQKNQTKTEIKRKRLILIRLVNMHFIYAINILFTCKSYQYICPKPAFDMGVTWILKPVSYIMHSRCSMMYTYYKCIIIMLTYMLLIG